MYKIQLLWNWIHKIKIKFNYTLKLINDFYNLKLFIKTKENLKFNFIRYSYNIYFIMVFDISKNCIWTKIILNRK